jgi:16S rRNA (guanine527-N7)-methyltransferase
LPKKFDVNPVITHFPELTIRQMDQLERLDALYRFWNERINVISRKDIDHLYLHHVLHSLAIARFISFKPGTRILDAGTGGGFPGIPLAILFPEAQWVLADSIAKKITVIEAVTRELGLKNVKPHRGRVEQIDEKFDYVVSRAVTSLPEFNRWVHPLIRTEGFNDIPNGIIYLKGGDLSGELDPFKGTVSVVNISDYFEEPFFETKKIIFIPAG